jgi:hypothetical protein
MLPELNKTSSSMKMQDYTLVINSYHSIDT